MYIVCNMLIIKRLVAVKYGKKGMIKIPYVFHVKHFFRVSCVVSVICGLNWLFVALFSVSFHGWPSQPRAPALRSPMGAPAPPLPPFATLRSAVAFGPRGAACCVPAAFGLNCGRYAPALTASGFRPAGRADARPRAPRVYALIKCFEC